MAMARCSAAALALLLASSNAFVPAPSHLRPSTSLGVKQEDPKVAARPKIGQPMPGVNNIINASPAPAPEAEAEVDTSGDLFLKLQFDMADGIAFAGRAVDTIEDGVMHLRRTWEPQEGFSPLGTDLTREQGVKPRLIVLGTGWGGHALVKVIDHTKFDIVVVSPRNCFVFTPMLAASSVGTVDTSSITECIKEANPHITYVQGSVRAIDPEKKAITVEAFNSQGDAKSADVETFQLDYSKLVYAVGSKTGTFGVKGVLENCYCLKEVSDARRLRRALLRRFDEASFPGVSNERRRELLAFLVIGTGPTGIEFTGELSDFLASDVPRLFPELMPFISLKVMSADRTILPMFDKVLQQKGMETLQAAGADVMLNVVVQEIKPGMALLKDGTRVPFGLCFWAGGTEARKLTLDTIPKIAGQSDMEGAKRGQLTVDGWMRVKGVKDGSILGIGDAVRVDGQRLPTTGQVAAQEGAYVARLLNRGYLLGVDGPPVAPSQRVEEGQEPPPIAAIEDVIRLRGDLQARPFHFLNLGVLAYLGSGEGLAQIAGGDKTKVLDASGKIGFWLWRSTYLVKQVSMRNRVCVVIDWIKAKAFGRNFTSPSDHHTIEE